jgi:hypothetical protein
MQVQVLDANSFEVGLGMRENPTRHNLDFATVRPERSFSGDTTPYQPDLMIGKEVGRQKLPDSDHVLIVTEVALDVGMSTRGEPKITLYDSAHKEKLGLIMSAGTGTPACTLKSGPNGGSDLTLQVTE